MASTALRSTSIRPASAMPPQHPRNYTGPAKVAAGTSHPSAFRSAAHSQNFDYQIFVDGAPKPMQVPRPMPPIDNRTDIPRHIHLTSPSSRVGFVEAEQFLAPCWPATYSFSVPQRHHLGVESLHLPGQYLPQLQLHGSTFRGSAYPPSFMDGIPVDRALDGISHQPTWSPYPIPPVGSVAPQHMHHAFPSNSAGFVPRQRSLATQPISHALTAPQQQFLRFDPSVKSSSQYWPQQQQQSTGMFNQANNCAVTGTFIDGNVTYNNASSNEFMEKLLKETIPGAAYDSSARDPPPRCHPGTRLAILERCLYFIHKLENGQKMRWVVGSAGVGKSAIMQSVAESPDLRVDYHASVFFSINGRNDGTKTIMTISYQCAAKCEPYRQVIEREITRDPSLLRSSMANQFKRLIIEPFINDAQLKSAGRILIILDGLDECNDPRTQQELLHLISDFCVTYPSTPLVWLIASRPEPHITSFFSRPEVTPVYEKEEIQVDSDSARSDVERFLRYELNEIKNRSDSLDPRWPEERDIWKLASAAGGLFAYAKTVVRYIADWRMGNPVALLSDVLHVIDKHSMTDRSGDEHPMALLDALYARILSNVPPKIMTGSRKLLLALASDWDYALNSAGKFIILCNWLGMTPDEAYAALNHLRSVLDVPRRDEASLDSLKPFHKSFIDYVSDFTRSGFSSDIQSEARQLMTKCALRILKEAPDGITVSLEHSFLYGHLACVYPTGDEISLTWSVGQGSGWGDIQTRMRMYQLAIGEVVGQIKRGHSAFESELCVRLLKTRFAVYSETFPLAEFRYWVFAEPQRSDFMVSGALKRVPLETVNISAVLKYEKVKLWFRGPTRRVDDSFYPWCSSCQHEQIGEWAEGKIQDWITFFSNACAFCSDRLEQQLRDLKARSPDHTVLMLFTSTNVHCVEVHFVDPEDGVSEWTCWFWFNHKR